MSKQYDHHWKKGLDKRKGLPVDTKTKDQIEIAKKLLRKARRKSGKAYGKIYCRQSPRSKPLPMTTITYSLIPETPNGLIPPWEGLDEFTTGDLPGDTNALPIPRRGEEEPTTISTGNGVTRR